MVIFNEAKPKYEKLDELLETQLINIKFSNQVNIIIDLKEIVRKFFRPDIELYGNKRLLIEEISSDIINIISHYRNYFYKKGKFTTFYFLYSFNKCNELIKINSFYKQEYYEKYFNENDDKATIIKKAIQVVQKVTERIPHAKFIETSDFDEFIYTKYLLSIIPENELTIILSNDDIFFQLLNDNIFILNIKGIKSELLNCENLINIITKRDEYKISSKMVPLILSLSGTKKTSLQSIPSIGLLKACNIVDKLIKEDKVIDADSINIPIQFSQLNEKNRMEKMLIENKELITNNYKFIRGDEILYSNKILIAKKFVEKPQVYTSNCFKELNSKIFVEYPLQIEMLLKGEKI